MSDQYASYNTAHTQSFDVNAQNAQVSDWGLYNAAHADPDAIPIDSIQASPATMLEASGHHIDAVAQASDAQASVHIHPDTITDPSPDATTLAQYEAIAPGLALALLQADQTREHQRRQYRIIRLVVTTFIAVTAIACGQWALVNGADQQALYLSTAGLVSLITTVLQHD